MKQSKNASRAFGNNRKTTNGRTVQVVPIFDKKTGVVIDTKKVYHKPQKPSTTPQHSK